MKVVWLDRVVTDLEAVRDCIAHDDPDAASRVAQVILRAVDLLATAPAMGRAGRKPGTRELVVSGTPYIMPYRVRGQRIEILRVFHARRQWRP